MASAPTMRHQPIQHRPEFLARMGRLKIKARRGRVPLPSLCMQRGQWGAWDSGTMLTLAHPRCHQCGGTGHVSFNGKVQPCKCVLREVFRRCWERWRVIEAEPIGCSSVTLERLSGHSRSRSYGRKKEEFAADFFLVSRRTLAGDPLLAKIFRLRVLLGADWRLCTRELRIDRGTYFHAVYEMEEKLGRVFHELRPYALHPVSDYFGKRMKDPNWSAAQ